MKIFSPKNRSAFSLPEVVVGIAVLVSVIVSVGGLLTTSMRANRANENRFIAYYLAQEGLEAMRNMRDSNWLQGLDWRSEIQPQSIAKESLWGGSFKTSGTYVIDHGAVDLKKGHPRSEMKLSTLAMQFDNAKQRAPWELKVLSSQGGSTGGAKLYRHEVNGAPLYSHKQTIGASRGIDSLFERRIFVEEIVNEQDSTKYPGMRIRVRSEVKWKDGWGEKSLDLVTELTDWKRGPL